MSQLIPNITPSHLSEVMAFHEELSSIKFHKTKRDRFTQRVATLSGEGLWLLTFCSWFSLFNFRFKQIDESLYYAVPVREENESTFKEFIDVVRFFNRKKVTPSREGILIKFLMTCDQAHKDFYLSILTKQFVKALPLVDVQTVLDLDSIEVQSIYGPIEILTSGFSDLEYPVAVRSLPDPSYPLCVFAKEPHNQLSWQLDQGEFRKVSHLLPADVVYANTPRYTLVGFADSAKQGVRFYPVDFFPTSAAFRSGAGEYPARVEALQQFLTSNLLTQTATSPIRVARSEPEVLPAVLEVMAGAESAYICLSDRNTHKTGKAYAVEVRVTTGIIDSFWVEAGSVRGFMLWFNGELFPCTFSFGGLNNALLNSIEHVQGKLLEFLYIKIGGKKVGVGRQLLYSAPTWRVRRLRGSDMMIEKCIMCGTTETPHSVRGICHQCERNLHRFWKQYGPDNWIPISNTLRRNRRKACWEPSLMNAVDYWIKGHRLVAREGGEWMFCPPEKARGRPELTE